MAYKAKELAGAYKGPKFSVDGRVFMILKCRETSYFLETRNNQMFLKAVTESEDGADKQQLTIMDKYIQDGVSLSKNVDNSGYHH